MENKTKYFPSSNNQSAYVRLDSDADVDRHNFEIEKNIVYLGNKVTPIIMWVPERRSTFAALEYVRNGKGKSLLHE